MATFGTTSTLKKVWQAQDETVTFVQHPGQFTPDPRDADYPELHNFYDVVDHFDALSQAVMKHPEHDYIYHFKHLRTCQLGKKSRSDETLPKEFLEEPWDWVVAGSAALAEVQEMFLMAARMRKIDMSSGSIQGLCATLEQYGIAGEFLIKNRRFDDLYKIIDKVIQNGTVLGVLRTEIAALQGSPVTKEGINSRKIAPSDTDIFFLNAKANHRIKGPHTDFVHTKAVSVEELLINFDLPCCRAAWNSRSDYWISAQCLYSMVTGTYYLPDYTKGFEMLMAVMSNYRTITNDTENRKRIELMLFKRLTERIQKYADRGFKVQYVFTDDVAPWIRNRFHYGEWKNLRDQTAAQQQEPEIDEAAFPDGWLRNDQEADARETAAHAAWSAAGAPPGF